jgi:DNA-directed RNA polymerase subunit RPC12/RpoP
MALPKLNDLPSYSLTIPSSKRKVNFRPFLVKEQKILLMAMESQDNDQILQAISDTLKSCIEEELTDRELATFDIEYLFTQIRSKSVGETTKLNLMCSECKTNNEVIINLSEISVELTLDTVIKLNDNYSLEMRYPSYYDVSKIEAKNNSTTDEIMQLSKLCLSKILTEDEQIDVQDESDEEIQSFMESLTTDQFDKIVNFVMNLPKLTKNVNYTCSECDKENEILVEGLQNFLS